MFLKKSFRRFSEGPERKNGRGSVGERLTVEYSLVLGLGRGHRSSPSSGRGGRRSHDCVSDSTHGAPWREIHQYPLNEPRFGVFPTCRRPQSSGRLHSGIRHISHQTQTGYRRVHALGRNSCSSQLRLQPRPLSTAPSAHRVRATPGICFCRG